MKLYRPLLTFMSALMLASCGGADRYQPQELPLNHIQALWQNTRLNERYVIRSESEWQSVWALHEPRTIPATQRPSLDFQASMILGLTLGSGSNGCEGVSIRRAVEEEREIRVEYRQNKVDPSMACTASIVSLTDFVSVPQSDKHVVFVSVDN